LEPGAVLRKLKVINSQQVFINGSGFSTNDSSLLPTTAAFRLSLAQDLSQKPLVSKY